MVPLVAKRRFGAVLKRQGIGQFKSLLSDANGWSVHLGALAFVSGRELRRVGVAAVASVRAAAPTSGSQA